jgi:hypothetical protein
VLNILTFVWELMVYGHHDLCVRMTGGLGTIKRGSTYQTASKHRTWQHRTQSLGRQEPITFLNTISCTLDYSNYKCTYFLYGKFKSIFHFQQRCHSHTEICLRICSQDIHNYGPVSVQMGKRLTMHMHLWRMYSLPG